MRFVSLKRLGDLDTGSDIHKGKRCEETKGEDRDLRPWREALDRSFPNGPLADSLISGFQASELPDYKFLFKSSSLLYFL